MSFGGDLGFESELFKAADKLRGNMEPSDYKHVALGLIVLKHISDSFEAKHAALLAQYPDGAEDPDEHVAENVFWVPTEARYVLTPGRYVGAAAVEDDETPFVEQFAALQETLDSQFAEDQRLEQAIRENLGRVGLAASEV